MDDFIDNVHTAVNQVINFPEDYGHDMNPALIIAESAREIQAMYAYRVAVRGNRIGVLTFIDGLPRKCLVKLHVNQFGKLQWLSPEED